jgi:hypothetical protein
MSYPPNAGHKHYFNKTTILSITTQQSTLHLNPSARQSNSLCNGIFYNNILFGYSAIMVCAGTSCLIDLQTFYSMLF